MSSGAAVLKTARMLAAVAGAFVLYRRFLREPILTWGRDLGRGRASPPRR